MESGQLQERLKDAIDLVQAVELAVESSIPAFQWGDLDVHLVHDRLGLDKIVVRSTIEKLNSGVGGLSEAPAQSF